MPTYTYECVLCKKVFDAFNDVEHRELAFCCGFQAMRIKVNQFETDRDLSYTFTHPEFKTQIHSKGQYKRLLKEHGRVRLTNEEIKSIKPPDKSLKRKAVVKTMAEKMHKDGVLKHVPSFLKTQGILGGK